MDALYKEYEKNYNNRWLSYKDKYEDNTQTSFLEIELENYTKYYNSLASIKNHFKNYTVDEIKKLKIYSGVAKELKTIDINIYYDIVTELKKDGDEVDFINLSEEELLKDLILIDFEKLNNHITSAKRILDFIKDEQESMVPGDETTVNDESNSEPKKTVNPYPRIFKDDYAYSVFEKILEQFGNTEKNLANYSFVYHSMIKDKLIYHNIKQLEYYDLLADFDISISRITGVNTLGNTQFRESIYAAAK